MIQRNGADGGDGDGAEQRLTQRALGLEGKGTTDMRGSRLIASSRTHPAP